MYSKPPQATGQITGTLLAGTVVVWSTLCFCGQFLEHYAPRLDLAGLLLLSTLLFRLPLSDQPIAHGTFLAAIVIAGIRSSEAELACFWAVKLGIIFSFTSSLRYYPKLCHSIFQGLQIAVFLNAGIVLLALVGVQQFLVYSGEGRAFTVLTYSGVLARIGISCLFYYLYLVANSPRISLADVAGLAACLAIMWQDGSRTAAFLATPIVGLVVLSMMAERRYNRLWIVGLLALYPAYQLGIALTDLSAESSLVRIQSAFENVFSGNLQDLDEARYDLAQHAIGLIREEPVLGAGFRTAVLGGSEHETGFQVVHNAYLQLWAETGLMGLLPFIVIMWRWTARAKAAIAATRAVEDIRRRAYNYNMLYLLFYSGLCYATHPFGTECCDWILFSAAYAAIHGTMPQKSFTNFRPPSPRLPISPQSGQPRRRNCARDAQAIQT